MGNTIKALADIDTFAAANSGTAIDWIEPETADVLYVRNAGKGFYMLVNNLSAINAVTLTFATPGTTTNLDVPIDDYVYVAAVSVMKQIGPFTPIATFNTLAGDTVAPLSVKCTITGTIVSGELQIALIAVP